MFAFLLKVKLSGILAICNDLCFPNAAKGVTYR